MVTLTIIIVIFTCLISYQAFNDQGMKHKFIFHPASVKEFGQFYRFLTAGFLHKDFLHLGVNMFVLWQFGEKLEIYLMKQFDGITGRLIFLGIYLGAIIIGSLPSYIKHSDNQYYKALGASGGVAGILFASIFIQPWGWLGLFLVIPLPYVVFGVLYLLYESYMGKRGQGLIAHDAHIAGAVFGYLGIILIFYILQPNLVTHYLEVLKTGPTHFPSFFGG